MNNDKQAKALLKTILRLCDVARLEDNWDGCGSTAPGATVVMAALGLVQRLADSADHPLPEAFVCPISGGGLQLDWDLGARHIEIEFLDKDRLAVLTEDTSGSSEAMETYEFPASRADRIKDLFDWLTLPHAHKTTVT